MILYDEAECLYNNNGYGRLAEAIRAEVVEEINGAYTLEVEYPISGKRYAELKIGRQILCRHDDSDDMQPFRIYRISRPISGRVMIYARHVSYDLANVPILPFMAASAVGAVGALQSNANFGSPFTFYTDIQSSTAFSLAAPASVRAVMGGLDDSIISVYGGEWEFNRYHVRLLEQRGDDNHVRIRYGKNLTDLTRDTDIDGRYSAVLPYYVNGETGELVTLPELTLPISGAMTYSGDYRDQSGTQYDDGNGNTYNGVSSETRVLPLDMSAYFWEAPTVANLRTEAQKRIKGFPGAGPADGLKVSFINLWQTEEYKDYAPLQSVCMGDTVEVYYPALDVSVNMRVVRATYDLINMRYSEIELGTPSYNMTNAVVGISEGMAQTATRNAIARATAAATSMVEQQTQMIAGQNGGNFVVDKDAAGRPIGWLIMDTAVKATAKNVLRANLSGIGFSPNGYNGPFTTAWTIDGKFNADFIQTGTLNADLITTGGMSAARITSGTIDAARLNLTEYAKFTDLSTAGSTTINGGNITTGTLSANRIKAGILTDEAGNFSLNMETGELSMQNGTFTGTVGSSLLSAIGAVYLQNGRIITYEGPDLETVLNTELVSDWPWYGYVITNEGGSLGGYEWRLDNSTILMVTKRQPIKLTPCLSMQGDITLTGTLSGSVSETQTGSYNGLTIVLYKNAGCVTCYIRGTTTEAMATGSAYVTLYTPANASWMPAERMVSYQQLTVTYRGQVNPTTTGIQLGYTRNSSNTVADIPAGTPIYCMLTWAAK